MSNTIRNKPNINQKQALIRVSLVLAGLLGAILLIVFIGERRDINSSTSKLKYIQSHVDEVVGSKTNSSISEFCDHYNPVSDFDKGRRSCGKFIVGVYEVKNAENDESIKSRIYSLLNSSHVFADSKSPDGALGYYDLTKNNLRCSVSFENNKFDKPGEPPKPYRVGYLVECTTYATFAHFSDKQTDFFLANLVSSAK